MKRVITSFLLSFLLNSAVAAAAEHLDPEALVRQTSDRMLTVLKEQHDVIKAEPKRLYGLVDDIVLPHFDFERMARWVLGKYWRQASLEQQQSFIIQFRTLLVRTYGTALLEYSDQQVNFLPVRMSADTKDVTVRTEVLKPGGPAIPISYSMLLRDDGWKVYDVVIDGISLVSNYRTTFSTEIKNAGIEGLIQRLAERNAQEGT
ncbi:MAG: ABC transporter substrate-binding protein [Gammaproteobacteria bacterium]|nr:ABC transporter substrate-binding protein [Gammaproteobacteria bacterium]